MQRHGEEVHETTDEARAGSTPNIVRWVLAISLLAAVVLLSGIWIFGAATTPEEDSVATATDREAIGEGGESTDSVVSDQFVSQTDQDAADAADAAESGNAATPE
jgi:hypothetical protein